MDNEGFWNLLRPIHPAASAFCRKLTGDPDEGDDLYQDALLAALRRFDQLKNDDSFRPWLYRIIVNRFKNRCRGHWLSRRVELKPDVIDSIGVDDPERRFERRRLLGHLMSSLPAEDRALVVLHELQGWSIEELSSMFSKPEGTIKIRLFRARDKMRKVLKRHLRQNTYKSQSLEVVYAMQRCKALDE